MTRSGSLRWILLSLLAFTAAAVMVRLGFWQLDRLAQRRAFNDRVRSNQAALALDLNQDSLSGQPVEYDYRSVVVEGTYQTGSDVMLRNQVEDGQIGVHILTVLDITGTGQSVVVDRGWVPLADANPIGIQKYAQAGVVKIKGVVRMTQKAFKVGSEDAAGGKITAINVVDISELAAETSSPLLPFFIQEAPGDQPGSLPIRSQPELDLSEGPHASYALQWFTFAAILVIGYPIYVYKNLHRPERTSRRVSNLNAGEHRQGKMG
jgi:surfeit locus 1 family protein